MNTDPKGGAGALTEKQRWLAAVGLAWLCGLAQALDVLDPVVRAQAQGIEDMAFAVLLAVFFHWALGLPVCRKDGWLAALGGFLGLCALAGETMAASDSLAFLYSGPVCFLKALVRWLGWAVLLYFALLALFAGLDRLAAPRPGGAWGPAWLRRAGPKTVLCGLGVILACWLPYYVCLFPGASNTDTWWQLEQATGARALNAGHPLAHTYLQSGLLVLGKTLLGSWNAGAFLAVLAQSLVIALVLAYSVHVMLRLEAPPAAAAGALALYALVPTFPRAATLLMKDGLYSAGVLLLTLLVLEALLLPADLKAHGYKKALLCAGVFLTATMRYNGPVLILAVLALGGVGLWRAMGEKRARLALAACLVLPLAAGYGLNAGLRALPGVEPANPNETLSIPLQQTARYVRDFGGEVTDAEREAIDRVVQYGALADTYNPNLADPVKSYINRPEAIEADRQAYLKVWLAQTLRRPVSALEAFVNLNYGWLYPGVQNPCWSYSPVGDNAYVTRPAALDTLEHLLDKLDYAFLLPVLSWPENLGFAAWGLLALGAWLAARGVKQLGGALAVQYLTLLMCLFGPVFYGHGRYGWPLLFCWPALLAAAVCAVRRKTREI
ncbi:DUF6020 family protein [Allofournierella sp.]|uniref:DUF6020 family protein n=1 Tax=Allofournierella sp. TaxID=1940256 RepID=UPI003AB44CFB